MKNSVNFYNIVWMNLCTIALSIAAFGDIASGHMRHLGLLLGLSPTKPGNSSIRFSLFKCACNFVVVYVHGKQQRSCRDDQLT